MVITGLTRNQFAGFAGTRVRIPPSPLKQYLKRTPRRFYITKSAERFLYFVIIYAFIDILGLRHF